MPILKDFRTTKTITLPTYPDSKVEVYDSLLVGQMAQLGITPGNQFETGLKSVHLFIKSWNFTDEAGAPLPIDAVGVGFLKQDDLIYLIDQVVQFSNENKKKDEPSPQSATA